MNSMIELPGTTYRVIYHSADRSVMSELFHSKIDMISYISNLANVVGNFVDVFVFDDVGAFMYRKSINLSVFEASV